MRVETLLQPPLSDHSRFLDRLLQLGPEPANLRLLQPGVPGGFQEDPAELLSSKFEAGVLEVAEVKGRSSGELQQRLERAPR